MKANERKFARRLRQSGYSVGAIAGRTGCSKSSISKWVRDISLTPSQIARLKSNQDKGRAIAADHPNSPKHTWSKIRNNIIESASKEILSTYSPYVLKTVGTALYWAEGYKSAINIVHFSNSDPIIISLMMRFFKDICKVPIPKFRGAVHIHSHLNKEKAIRFWSRISGIPIKQFHKTQIAISRASKNKRDTLPFGTLGIFICDTRLQSKIKGWIQGLTKWAVGAAG